MSETITIGQTWRTKKRVVIVTKVDYTSHGIFIHTSDDVAYGKKAFLSLYSPIEDEEEK